MFTVGADYGNKKISGMYTRIIRDSVLAEWIYKGGVYFLNIYCPVRGCLVFGTSSMRESIFLREMPLVLEVLRFRDRDFFYG